MASMVVQELEIEEQRLDIEARGRGPLSLHPRMSIVSRTVRHDNLLKLLHPNGHATLRVGSDVCKYVGTCMYVLENCGDSARSR